MFDFPLHPYTHSLISAIPIPDPHIEKKKVLYVITSYSIHYTKLYDAANDGVGSSDGFDGWYNVDNAVAELTTAVAELSAEGLTISRNNFV